MPGSVGRVTAPTPQVGAVTPSHWWEVQGKQGLTSGKRLGIAACWLAESLSRVAPPFSLADHLPGVAGVAGAFRKNNTKEWCGVVAAAGVPAVGMVSTGSTAMARYSCETMYVPA